MRTKGSTVQLKQQAPKINVITLGCSKNIVDSETLMGQLKSNNLNVVHESETIGKDDTVIINTCGFIENAKQESIDTILQYSELKAQGKVGKLIVTGCLSERYKSELSGEIDHVDAFYGTKDLENILTSLGADYKTELIGERLLTTPQHFAFLKIAEGCNRPCSFCAIPLMRGMHASKSMEAVVKEAALLAQNGTKELVLIAQDLTYYGVDLYNDRKLPELLRRLSDVNGIEWIRLQYAYPSQFPMEVFKVMNERENICNYLDMPLQHISDNMLKSMRRGITKRRTVELVDTIRQTVPNIALRTTLISGYPGETLQDHEELLEFVEKTGFDRLGVFTYSHEENTHAYTLNDDVPEEEKQRRLEEIMDVQQGISYDKNQKKIGQTFKVLIDRQEGNDFIARTEFDSPEVDNEVIITDGKNLKIGEFYQVKIDSAEDFDLYASPSPVN